MRTDAHRRGPHDAGPLSGIFFIGFVTVTFFLFVRETAQFCAQTLRTDDINGTSRYRNIFSVSSPSKKCRRAPRAAAAWQRWYR